jgi:multidrug efflux pump subunit AcrA (membrane-fusion protein)
MVPRISGWLVLAAVSLAVLLAACVNMAPVVLPRLTGQASGQQGLAGLTAHTTPTPAMNGVAASAAPTATPRAVGAVATVNPLANRKVVLARRGPISETILVGGRVSPEREVSLAFSMRGSIDTVNVEVGQTVRQGDLLLALDSADARKQVDDLRGQIDITRARQADMQSRLDEIKRAKAADAVARVDAATRKAQLAQQQIAEATAKAEEQLKLAKVNMERTQAGASPADRFAAEAGVATARGNIAKAESDQARLVGGPTDAERRAAEQAVAVAQITLKKAEAERDKLLRPPNPAVVASARRDVADAQAGVERAASTDPAPNAPKISAAERQSRQEAADFALKAARAQLDALLKGPDKATVELANMAVDGAQASLDTARAQLDELIAPPTQFQLDGAANAVSVAGLALKAAEAHLDELKSHPTVEELRVAQKQVADAQAALERAASPAEGGPVEASSTPSTAPSIDNVPSLVDQMSLQHTLEQQEIQLQGLEQQIAASELRAPFDGVVESVQVKPGDAIEGRRAVVVLAGPEPPVVMANLSDADAARLPVGSTVNLQVEASTAQLHGVLAAYADSTAGGRRGIVRVDWPDPAPASGANIQLQAVVGQKADALLVPLRAVKGSGERRTAEIVDQAGQRSIVDLKLGITSGEDIEVLSGVVDGQAVVLPN